MAPGKYTPKARVPYEQSPGSGPYAADKFTDDSLPVHTIYAPKTPPAGQKLPVLIFGNGGCANVGTAFQNFLREIASHGFIALANGAPGKGGFDFGGGQSKMSAMTASLEWASKGGANGKFGAVDTGKIAVAGQSCGGLEAYSASYREPRIKATILLNSGVIDADKVYMLQELKAPVALFIGGPKDIAYEMVSALSRVRTAD
jgi:dienelactone hydrolase